MAFTIELLNRKFLDGGSYPSCWFSAFMPVLFQVHSDKYPTNTASEDTATSVQDSSGFLRINFTSTPGTIKKKLKVIVTGNYAGVYTVLERETTYIVVDTAYVNSTNISGIKRAYSGYYIKTDVNVGLDSHPQTADQPNILSGSNKSIPNTSNLSNVDVSNYSRYYIQPFNLSDEDYFTPVFKCMTKEFSRIWNFGDSVGVEATEYFDDLVGDDVVTVSGSQVQSELASTGKVYVMNGVLRRNEYGGNYQVYVPDQSYPTITAFPRKSKWLNDGSLMAAFRGHPFQMRFIMTENFTNVSGMRIRLLASLYDKNNVLISTTNILLNPDPIGEGVYICANPNYPTMNYDANVDSIVWEIWYSVGVTTPTRQVVESKRIKLFDVCEKKSITITWLNELGGWEQFTFIGNHLYSGENTELNYFNSDIESDFDVNFIAGRFNRQILNKESKESIKVRSQNMTVDIYDWVNKILFSPCVYMVDGDRLVGVEVTTKSLDFKQTLDKLFSFQFEIDIAETIKFQHL